MLIPNSANATKLEKSFFYRTYMTWNSLPLEIRELEGLTEFKSKVEARLWNQLLSPEDEGEGDDGQQLDIG